jgi:hypothetical protein
MGLTNWRGTKPRKQDAGIAKNYLNEPELSALNNLVEQYLVFAEGQAIRRIPMTMHDWIEKLHGFLNLNDRDILDHAGKISHQLAIDKAEKEYEKFNVERSRHIESDFDKEVKKLLTPKKKKGK